MTDLSRVIQDLIAKDRKERKCASEGHPGEVVLSYEYNSWRAYCSCTKCYANYFRPMNPTEIEEGQRRLGEPMTI